jgi:hypothetical protein
MRYSHHLHKTLDDRHIGEKVLLVHRPTPTGTVLVSNGLVDSVNAAFVRVVWERK